LTRARGYPYLFESAESYARFRAEAESLVKRFNLPEGELVVQGSAWRTPAAKDVDVALFVSDEQFAAYAERCRQGIRDRATAAAGGRVVKNLDAYVDRGFIPMFYFDRTGKPTFADAVRDVLGAVFNIELDFSVMKRSSSVALHPSSADL
jgi:hypothetical protein